MKVGDYVRTKKRGFQPSQIARIKSMEKDSGYHNQYYIELDHNLIPDYEFHIYKDDIGKSSSNIMDLIEFGDYVNGERVIYKQYKEYPNPLLDHYVIDTIRCSYREDEIKSIVTKEQFESITGTKVVVQGKVPVVAKKVTTKNAQKKKKTVQKKKKTIKKSTKKVQKKKVVKKKKKTYKTYRITYNKSEVQAYAHNLVLSYGWSEYDFECLVKLWNRESNWNLNAVNKRSGACGIPQSLPCSKMKSAGADYRTNWKVQVNWGLDYIKNVYGTPSEAYRKFLGRKPHWY